MNGIFQTLYQGFNFMTSLPEHIIEPMEFLPEFLKEALIDSLNLVPFLFVIFILIEVLERYFAKKKVPDTEGLKVITNAPATIDLHD